MKYGTFFAMILSSSVLMYFTMYLHTYVWDHVFFSETRLYMTFLMASVMAVVMLWFMQHMYTNKRMNRFIYIGSISFFLLSLFLVRSQILVDDVSYMRAMIPHHSIAILTSERAQIENPKVKELADEIIEAQRREIDEMRDLLEELESQ